MEEVTWKKIPGFDGYEASSDGQIRGRKGALKPWDTPSPGDTNRVYSKVGLYKDGKRHRQFVHRLVCLAFHGAAPEGEGDVCHVNHSSQDNRASNLRWGSHASNIADTYSDESRERRAIFEESLGLLFYSGPSDGCPF